MEYSRFDSFTHAQSPGVSYDLGLRRYMLNVYNFMAMGLGFTGLIAFLIASTPAMQSLFFVMSAKGVGLSPLGWLAAFAPLGISLVMGFGFHRLSANTVQMLFWAYAALMGVSLSSLFMVYTGTSIVRAFMVTACTFGAMSLYGYTTKRDLTALGSFLMMATFGILLAVLVNSFLLKSSGFQLVISIVTVLVFTGLTAYDTQRLKETYYIVGGTGEQSRKCAIYGAFGLYTNFIAIFMQLVHLLGDRR
jgi:FtsH-binding integral membrane protein